MKVAYLVLTAILFGSVTTANARPYPDKAGVCIIFKGDTVLTKDVCVVSPSEGAGGKTTILKTFDKSYRVEAEERSDPKSDELNDVFKFTVNGEVAEGEYYRNASFYHIGDIRTFIELEEDYLYCYKTKSVDICHSY